MNFKTTYLLFGILLVVLGLFAFALWYDPTARQDNTLYVLPELRKDETTPKTDAVTKIVIQRNEPKEETIVLEKDAATNRWSITEPRKLRADSFAVNGLVQQLFGATREDKVDEAPSLSTWGLEPPQVEVTITKSGKDYKLYLGKGNSSGDLYVLDPTRPKQAMVVRKNKLSDLLKKLDDFRETDLLAAATSDIESVALGTSKQVEVSLKKDSQGGWVYTKPANYGAAESGPEEPGASAGAPKAPSSMGTVLTDITNLKADKTDKERTFIDNVTDWAKYNLGDKDQIFRITVTKLEVSGKDAEGKLQTKPVERTLLVGVGKKVDDKSDQYYAHLEGEDTVVRVSGRDVDALRKLVTDTGALRDRQLVRLPDAPSAVEVKNAYGTFELYRTHAPKLLPQLEALPGAKEPDRWTLWQGDKYENVEPNLAQGPGTLIGLIRQMKVDSFVDLKEGKDAQAQQERELDLDKPAAVIQVWDDEDGLTGDDATDKQHGKPDEKRTKPKLKEKEPTYRLSFGKIVNERDKELVVVKRERKRKDGLYDVTLVKVSKLLLDKAKEGPLAYRSKALPHFTEQGLPPWPGVTKLTIQQGGKTIEVTREKDNEPWKIVKPTDLAGRNAEPSKVENVLGAMNRLSAVRLVAEKAKDDAELERDYGLKTPQTKIDIIVTKDGKPTTTTYDFGKGAPDGTVYAKQSQRDVIFTVDKSALAALPSDVLDPVIFHLEPDKVTKVSLTGWQNLVGSPVTLELERKDKKWELKKGPMNFNVDAAKVQKLLDDLRICRAESFVAFKTGPKPDMDLDLAKGALVIELTEGDAKPITLTIGKLDGDKGYYATSNRTDGDVFLLRKDIFDGPKSKPAYFSP